MSPKALLLGGDDVVNCGDNEYTGLGFITSHGLREIK